MQKLTVGRIVHYSRAGEWVAAICVAANPDRHQAEIYVFPAGGRPADNVTVDVRDVDDGHGANNDSWRWPPRV